MSRRRREKVVPFYPSGLFAPFGAEPCEHDLAPSAPVELHGVPRAIPALRCRRCPAIQLLEVQDVSPR